MTDAHTAADTHTPAAAAASDNHTTADPRVSSESAEQTASAASSAAAAASSTPAVAALPSASRSSSRATRVRAPIVDDDADGDEGDAPASASSAEDDASFEAKPTPQQAAQARAARLSQRLAARRPRSSSSSSESHTDDEEESPRAHARRKSKPRRLSSVKRPLSKSEKRARKLQQDDRADAQFIEDEYDLEAIKKAAKTAGDDGARASSRPRRSTRKSLSESGAGMSDDDGAEEEAASSSGDSSDSSSGNKKARASSSGRPSRRAAAKSASLNEESLFRHSIVVSASLAAPAETTGRKFNGGGATGKGWRQRRRFLSEAGLISPEEEESEDSSSEEELTPQQEAVYQRLQNRAPQLILAIRNNPEQAARLAKEAKAKKNKAAEGEQGQGEKKEDKAAEAPQPMDIDDKSSPSPAAASSASASGPVVIELSDSDDEERKSTDKTAVAPAAAADRPVKKEGGGAAEDAEQAEEEEEIIYQFLVKWVDMGYLHCEWIDEAVLNRFERGYDMIGRWLKRQSDGKVDMSEWDEQIYFPQNYLQVERIVARRGPKISPQKALEMLMQSSDKEAAAPAASKPKRQPARRSKAASDDDRSDDSDFAPSAKHAKARSAGAAADSDDDGDSNQYLVKWRDLPYDECTWESRRSIADDAAIRLYWERSQLQNRGQPKPREDPLPPNMLQTVAEQVGSIRFNNPDFRLRSYQLEGVSWMAFNWFAGRSGSILADEMGLGKTIQVVSFCQWLFQFQNVRGPFLIVAPLSTLPHWVREFAQTELNVVTMPNTAEAREVFKKNEIDMFEVDGQPTHVRGSYRFDVIVTAYSSVMTESLALGKIPFQLIVVDEAQRAKGISSKLTTILQGSLHYEHALLLTGTPLQNNLTELWSLLHTIAPKTFPKLNSFLEEYGTLTEMGQITELHSKLRPHLLRRLKEDVEKGLPPRTEIVIECEMTLLQKQFYRAVYDENAKFLTQLTGTNRKAKKKKSRRGDDDDDDLEEINQKVSTPSLMNIAMQLRHVCNHPYALKGKTAVEASRIAAIKADRRKAGLSTEGPEVDALVMRQLIESSGKLVLLSKLLPKLQSQGHRVLIFSQFKKLLDILEDFVHWMGMRYERLDGDVTGNSRQAAIDRFSAKDSDRFIFMLSTKAGGVGVNLASADTVIIFDSDWNPQNDIQAQARAHRIGQVKPVRIYRLITRGTYESTMFEKSSLKLGLDHAVLKSYTSAGKDGAPVLRREEIETMLRKGAYHVFLQNTESTQLTEDDIDVILKRDAHVVQYKPGGTAAVVEGADASAEDQAAGDGPMLGSSSDAAAAAAAQPSSSFSKASFVLNGEVIDIQSADFWTKVGLRAAPEEAPLPRTRRRNGKQSYNEDKLWERLESKMSDKRMKKRGRRPKGSDDEAFSADARSGSDSSASNDSSSSSSSDADSSQSDSSPARAKQTKVEPKDKAKRTSSGPAVPREPGVSPYAISVNLALALYDALESAGYNRWDTMRARVSHRGLVSDEIKLLESITEEGLKYFALGVIKQNLLLAPVGTPYSALSAASRAALEAGAAATPSSLLCKLAQCGLDFITALAILRDAESMVGRYASLAKSVIAAKIEEVRQKQAAAEMQQAMLLEAQQRQMTEVLLAQCTPLQLFQLQQMQEHQRLYMQQSQQAIAHTEAMNAAMQRKAEDTQAAVATLPPPPPGAAPDFIQLQLCAQCGKADIPLSKCGRCLCVAYCTRECQTKAWLTHKPLCAQWAADASVQAHAQYARAVITAREAITAKRSESALPVAFAGSIRPTPAAVQPASQAVVVPAPVVRQPSKPGVDAPCPKRCKRPANGADIPCEILGVTEGPRAKYVVHWAGYSRDPQHKDTTEQAMKPWQDTYPELVREWELKEEAEEREEERQRAARKQAKMEKKKKWLSEQKELLPPKVESAAPATAKQQPEASATTTDPAPPADAAAVAAAAPPAPAKIDEKESAMSDIVVTQSVEASPSSVAASPASSPAAVAAAPTPAAPTADVPSAAPTVVVPTSDASAAASSPAAPAPATNDSNAMVDAAVGSSAAAAAPATKAAPAEVIDLSADPSVSPPPAAAAAAASSGAPAAADSTSNCPSIPESLRTAGLPLGSAFVREMQVHQDFLSRPADKPETSSLSDLIEEIPVDPVLSHPTLLKRIGSRKKANAFLQSLERVHIVQQFITHDKTTGQWRFTFPKAFLEVTGMTKLALLPECKWWNVPQAVLDSGTLDLRFADPGNRGIAYIGNVDSQMSHDADLLLALYLAGCPPDGAERDPHGAQFAKTLSTAPHYASIRASLGDGSKSILCKAWGDVIPPPPETGAAMPLLQDQFGNLQAPPPPPRPVYAERDYTLVIQMPPASILLRRARTLVQSLATRGWLEMKLPRGHRPALTAQQANGARRVHQPPALRSLHAASDSNPGSASPADHNSAELRDLLNYTGQRKQINDVLQQLAMVAKRRQEAEAAERKKQAELQQQKLREQEARRIEAARVAQALQQERERKAREAAQAHAVEVARRASAAETERHRVIMQQQAAARAAEQLRQQQLAAQRTQAQALFQRQLAAQVNIAEQAAAQQALTHNQSVLSAAEAVKKQIADENAKAEEENRRLMAEIEAQMAMKKRLAQQRADMMALKAKLDAGEDVPTGVAPAASAPSASGAAAAGSAPSAAAAAAAAPASASAPSAKRKPSPDDSADARRAKKLAKHAEEQARAAVAAYAAASTDAAAAASSPRSRASDEHKSATNPSTGSKRKDVGDAAASHSQKKRARASKSKEDKSDSEAEGEDRTEAQRQAILRGKWKMEAQIAAIRAREDTRINEALAESEKQHNCSYCGHLSRSAYLRVQHEKDCAQRPRAAGEEEAKAEGAAPSAAAPARSSTGRPANPCPACSTQRDRRGECPNPLCLQSPAFVPEFALRADKSMRCTAFPCSYVAQTAPDGTLECANPKCVSVSARRRRARLQAGPAAADAAAAASTPAKGKTAVPKSSLAALSSPAAAEPRASPRKAAPKSATK